MTIDQYWSILLKHGKLIIICFIVIGLGAYMASKLMAPLYQSTALIQVTIRSDNNQADINSLLASDQLVQTEAQLAISDPVLRQVAAQYRDLSVEQLTKKVNVVVKPNTQLFEIDVLDTDPVRSAKIANDVANALIEQQDQFTQKNATQSQQHIQQDLQRTQKQIDATTRQIATLKEHQVIPDQINVLQATLDNLHQHYQQWQTLLTQLELAGAQGNSFLRVAQPAQQASSPAQPKVLFNTGIGLLAGLLTGLLLAMLLEQLDTRIRTEEALTQIVNWPILTTIWLQSMSKKGKALVAEDFSGEGANVESYRILRTNIGFSTVKRPVRSIVVVSATPHDGKSFIAANLATFMAKAGKKTLIVDADLRRPTIGKKFRLAPQTMGLSNAVLACAETQADTGPLSMTRPTSFSFEPYVHAVDTPNLFVMPSGPLPPNPPELFDSKAMESFFAKLAKSEFEIVLFDTPPLLGLSDASILVSQVDGVLVVVDITDVNKKNLKRMNTLLEQSKSYIIGCVINKQTPTRRDIAYAYAYYQESQQDNPPQGGVGNDTL